MLGAYWQQMGTTGDAFEDLMIVVEGPKTEQEAAYLAACDEEIEAADRLSLQAIGGTK